MGLFISLLLLFAVLLSGCSAQSKLEEEHTVGVFMALTAYGESAEKALTLFKDRIKKLEVLWSSTEANRDIYSEGLESGKGKIGKVLF